MGGIGGPYRTKTNSGKVTSVSAKDKAEMRRLMGEEAWEAMNARARKMGQEIYQQRLRELELNDVEWQWYNSLREKVSPEIRRLKLVIAAAAARERERFYFFVIFSCLCVLFSILTCFNIF